MAFAGGPIMAHIKFCEYQGIRTSITRKPYKFVIFQGGLEPLPPPPPPSGSAHDLLVFVQKGKRDKPFYRIVQWEGTFCLFFKE